MASGLRKRVLFAPRNISGQASEYREAIRQFGWEGEVWSLGEPAFGFGADRVLDKARFVRDPAYRWDILDEAVESFDVFHLQYGRSLVNSNEALPELWDLPLLKSLGKKVLMHFRGSDVRLPSVHREREPYSYFNANGVVVDEDRIRAKVSICRRYCDRLLVSTPGLIDYVPDAKWIPHVVDVAAWATPERPEPDVPLVVHVPSRRGTKGSDAIDEALTPLSDAGICVYEPHENLDREQLQALLRRADIVIDSITIGDHGLISVEAMAAGAIAVAHVHERNRARNRRVPVIEATPDTLAHVVRKLAADPNARRRLRVKGRSWVAARHDRHVVGRQLVRLYGEPLRAQALSHPEWPALGTPSRIASLEAEIEALRVARDPVLEDISLLTPSVSKFVLNRLITRIRELERAVRVLEPESPLLAHAPAPATRDRRGGQRDEAAKPKTPGTSPLPAERLSHNPDLPPIGFVAILVKGALPRESRVYVRARSVYWAWRLRSPAWRLRSRPTGRGRGRRQTA